MTGGVNNRLLGGHWEMCAWGTVVACDCIQEFMAAQMLQGMVNRRQGGGIECYGAHTLILISCDALAWPTAVKKHLSAGTPGEWF